jgi:hypothetical protein
VTVLREPTVADIGQLAAMQTAAPSFEAELQRSTRAMSASSNGCSHAGNHPFGS